METSKRRVTASEKTAMPTVLTIGHSTHPWTVFLALLRAHRVERVIDVRSVPRSPHNPQFNQETLRRKLRAARIGYVHLRKLGGLRNARRDSSNMGWRNSSFRGLADYMQTSEFDAGLQRLIRPWLLSLRPCGGITPATYSRHTNRICTSVRLHAHTLRARAPFLLRHTPA